MDREENGTDIIIPVCNQYPSTRGLLEGIYLHTDLPFHLYVVDNASRDETADLDRIYTRNITVIRNRRDRGWCAGANQGIAAGRNPNVVLMQSGVEVSAGWLDNLQAFLDTHPRIGAVGPLGPGASDRQGIDRVRERLAPQIPVFRTEDLHERNHILKYHFHRAGILVEDPLDFFCVLLKRRTLDAVGPLDDGPGGSGAEYCRRLRRAGYVLGLALDTYVLYHADPPPKAAARRGRSQGTYM
jgi:GT2 family glycosyltransferase